MAKRMMGFLFIVALMFSFTACGSRNIALYILMAGRVLMWYNKLAN